MYIDLEVTSKLPQSLEQKNDLIKATKGMATILKRGDNKSQQQEKMEFKH